MFTNVYKKISFVHNGVQVKKKKKEIFYSKFYTAI